MVNNKAQIELSLIYMNTQSSGKLKQFFRAIYAFDKESDKMKKTQRL